MAKIAVNSERRGTITATRLAAGTGWTVQDVVCTCGPDDRPFDEQHDRVSIAIVTSGTFQYRGSAANGRELMTPGSVLLGSPGQCFECGHEHGVGDRCLSFQFTAEYFDAITAGGRRFQSLRLPPLRALSPVIADACAALAGSAPVGPVGDVAWEELGVRLAARAVQLDRNRAVDERAVTPAAVARVTRAVRTIETASDQPWTLIALAREARLSPFHFLRTFETVAGITPHQYVIRERLRAAARRLAGNERITDIALGVGFSDISNFNRGFRIEFGVSPTAYRRRRSCGA